MHMRKFLCRIMPIMATTTSLWAQRTISGKVTDDKGALVLRGHLSYKFSLEVFYFSLTFVQLFS
jgi:hypothetical protein